MNESIPKVAILMATYNGLTWLPLQVESILNQENVRVTLYISDDVSADGTQEWLERLSKHSRQVVLLPKTERMGSAGKNFFRLLLDVDIADYDFVAFSDQDDIWKQDKLINHIALIKKHGADGVSSDILAFWPDDKQKVIVKSQPQRELDYLFESAGPGCTFLMTPWLKNKVRDELLDKNSCAQKVIFHDWLTYAICRAYGHKWVIDDVPSVKYRQHGTNVIGANIGIKAKYVRLQKIRSHWYRDEVIRISQVCLRISKTPNTTRLYRLLTNKNIFSQVKLLTLIPKVRRKALDRLLLTALILTGLF